MSEFSTQPVVTAQFNPLVRPYLVFSGFIILLFSMIGIPLVIPWLLGGGQWWARRYYEKLLCEVNDTELRFRKGIMFQVEKTIPLENIQDVTFIEGPLLRRFNLSTLKFETAGNSVGQANNTTLLGIVDAHELRAEILRRRTRLRARERAGAASTDGGSELQVELLRDIGRKLDDIAGLLREHRG